MTIHIQAVIMIRIFGLAIHPLQAGLAPRETDQCGAFILNNFYLQNIKGEISGGRITYNMRLLLRPAYLKIPMLRFYRSTLPLVYSHHGGTADLFV